MRSGETHFVTLPDDRRLALAEYGARDGRPLLYFHGFPGSRLEGRLIDDLAARRGVRVLAVDRPGFGRSDFQPGRTLLDWPSDIERLCDALRLDRFSVIGVSGGGPYAAACALRLGDRLDLAGIVCGLGPIEDRSTLDGMIATNRLGLLATRRVPWLPPVVFRALAPVFRSRPEVFISHLERTASAPDREFLRQPRRRQVFLDSFREAFRQGGRGPARDACLYSRPWGFRLGEVRKRVMLWHGEQDTVIPVAMGRHVAASLGDCQATFYPDDGHFSIALTRADEMFAPLSP